MTPMSTLLDRRWKSADSLLCVEDHRDIGSHGADMRDHPFESRLGAESGEVRDLWLEGTDQIVRRIHDLPTELEDPI